MKRARYRSNFVFKKNEFRSAGRLWWNLRAVTLSNQLLFATAVGRGIETRGTPRRGAGLAFDAGLVVAVGQRPYLLVYVCTYVCTYVRTSTRENPHDC
jgi:hypothetical protein